MGNFWRKLYHRRYTIQISKHIAVILPERWRKVAIKTSR